MKAFFLVSIFFLGFGLFAQNSERVLGENVSYRHYKKKFSATVTDFAVKGNERTLKANDSIHYKYQTNDWHFIRCTPDLLGGLMEKGQIEQIYFDPSKPKFLNDTVRIVQNVDSVLNGESPLSQPYTGKDIIVGFFWHSTASNYIVIFHRNFC